MRASKCGFPIKTYLPRTVCHRKFRVWLSRRIIYDLETHRAPFFLSPAQSRAPRVGDRSLCALTVDSRLTVTATSDSSSVHHVSDQGDIAAAGAARHTGPGWVIRQFLPIRLLPTFSQTSRWVVIGFWVRRRPTYILIAEGRTRVELIVPTCLTNFGDGIWNRYVWYLSS